MEPATSSLSGYIKVILLLQMIILTSGRDICFFFSLSSHLQRKIMVVNAIKENEQTFSLLIGRFYPSVPTLRLEMSVKTAH
jgi:hypothetical protein